MSYLYPPSRPKSFDDAVRIYNEIKPIKGKRAANDIRPLGKRTNHSQRIIKIDANNYALWPTSHWWMSKYDPDMAEVRIRAAVLWERTAEGDFCHVRNDWHTGGHVGHYSFLDSVLPHNLSFVTQNGKQYISQYVRGVRICHYLPHDKWMGGSKRATHSDAVEGPITPELVFKHNSGEQFTLVTKPHAVPRKLVDKETKSMLAPNIKEFKAWALLMAPMLNLRPGLSWPYTQAMQAADSLFRAQVVTDGNITQAWAESCGLGKIRHAENLGPRVLRQIVESEAHPLRVILASILLNAAGLRHLEWEVQSGKRTEKEAQTKFNASFNGAINRILGLVEEK